MIPDPSKYRHYRVLAGSPIALKFGEFEKEYLAAIQVAKDLAERLGAENYISMGPRVIGVLFPRGESPDVRQWALNGSHHGRSIWRPKARGPLAGLRKEMDDIRLPGGFLLQRRLTGSDDDAMYASGRNFTALTAEWFKDGSGDVLLLVPRCAADYNPREADRPWKPNPEEAVELTDDEIRAVMAAEQTSTDETDDS